MRRHCNRTTADDLPVTRRFVIDREPLRVSFDPNGRLSLGSPRAPEPTKVDLWR
ncbi:MAG TPA: hypothetical protein VHN14_10450 [Kofleriaceae bacterium]|jgi:hypothetical protein|nr:hypothetical protein [Kofleriaceae bacterium]